MLELDRMNINAYTLFRTEDALVKTYGQRELHRMRNTIYSPMVQEEQPGRYGVEQCPVPVALEKPSRPCVGRRAAFLALVGAGASTQDPSRSLRRVFTFTLSGTDTSAAWKTASGYDRQGPVENTFFRYTSIIGNVAGLQRGGRRLHE